MMKRKAVCLTLVVAVICFGHAWAGNPEPACFHGKQRAVPVQKALGALCKNVMRLEIRDRCVNCDLTWVEADFYDERYPLTLNMVARISPPPSKIIYLLTASSLNFKSSFFTPIEDSLAFYLAQHGYLVVGITPREDNVPLAAHPPRVMATWGMLKHRQDVRKVIRLVQTMIGMPYSVLGHSLGAVTALDYAGRYSEPHFRSVMVLDMPSFDPEQDDYAYKMACAESALDAYHDLLRDGVYQETSVADYKDLIMAAAFYPDQDSGVSRSVLGLPGNFTLDGLLHFSLIFTAYLPGIITDLTGLPQEWPMVLGNAAGYYDPADDRLKLLMTDIERLRLASAEVGSGIAPVALLRDYTSAIADLNDYRIHWAGIQEKVVWLNGSLGMSNQMYGAKLIRRSGNTNVTVSVLPNYGHVDVIYSETAREDVWSRLLTP